MSTIRDILKLRSAQRRFMQMVDDYRLCAILARRQYGKTTIFSSIALKKMMKRKNHTVVFGSAKINLAREIVRKEAFVMQQAIAVMRENELASKRLQVVNAETGRTPDKLNADDFAELFEAQRLEFRYYHSDSIYSRTKVVALRPDTVGETGDLMLDEVGRVGNFREVWEAVEPIISSDPTFRCIFSTTPPPDDTHFSFEMLVPPVGVEFPVNPQGNIYRSEMGITVLRVDAFDAWADGVAVFDAEKGEPLEPNEHRRRAHDKDAWDRNYGVKFVIGGSAACDLLRLKVAQERGLNRCQCFIIDSDLAFQAALGWIAQHLSPTNRIGLGLDVATTTKAKSNPSVLSIVEQQGSEIIARAVLVWKTKDPDIATDRVVNVVDLVEKRAGGPARALAIDATNEKYFAEALKKKLRAKIPVVLVVASEGVEKPGLDTPTNWKEFLGDQLVGVLDDNHLTLPPESYIRTDFRLVMKDRGKFVCEPDADGKHGDTFDGVKLGLHAVVGISGPFAYASVKISDGRTDRALGIGRFQGVLA